MSFPKAVIDMVEYERGRKRRWRGCQQRRQREEYQSFKCHLTGRMVGQCGVWQVGKSTVCVYQYGFQRLSSSIGARSESRASTSVLPTPAERRLLRNPPGAF
jgi:hypothetical protein